MTTPQPAFYAPYSTRLYRSALAGAATVPALRFVAFSETAHPLRGTRYLFVRHDIDTAACTRNVPLLLEIDREFAVEAGVYFRADGEQYVLRDLRNLVRSVKAAGFHVGLHTTCYLHDDYMGAFQHEIEEFTDVVGAPPESFNAHGMGQHRLDVRLKFYAEVTPQVADFGFKFSDCCPELRTYDCVIQDCYWDEARRRRYVQNDFVDVASAASQGDRVLILAHPCYWEAERPSGPKASRT